jgi:hypothetical protein
MNTGTLPPARNLDAAAIGNFGKYLNLRFGWEENNHDHDYLAAHGARVSVSASHILSLTWVFRVVCHLVNHVLDHA